MASLLGEHLFEVSGQGPPPPKDFFQLVITRNEVEYLSFCLRSSALEDDLRKKLRVDKTTVNHVIWRSWQISVRLECRGAAPKELKTSHHDFPHQKMLKQQVGAVFGQRILEHTISLCQGKFDYLERLPDDILLRILSYLQLKETTQLALVSQRFRQLCNSEKFWEQTVRYRCDEFTNDMEGIANAMGWRKTFFTFFATGRRKEQQ